MSGALLLVGGPSCSGRLISRRERQAFVCAVMAAQGRAGGKLGFAVVRHSSHGRHRSPLSLP